MFRKWNERIRTMKIWYNRGKDELPAVFGNVLRRGKGFRMGDEIVFAGGGDGESREKYLLTGKLYNKIAGLYDLMIIMMRLNVTNC